MLKPVRIPLALVAVAILVAVVVALRPFGGSTGVAPAAAAGAVGPGISSSPGALVPFLRFGGSGSVTVKPDRAAITVDAVGTASTSPAALAAASKRIGAVTAKLKELGVTDDDLRTSGASTYREWDTKDYRADISLTVTVRDPGQAGKLLAAANAAGADEVSGPSFSVEDAHAAYAVALKRAISDARAKADAAASQLGVRVTGVVSIDDSSAASASPMYSAADEAASSSAAPVPVQTGTQEITAEVTVVFSYAA